MNLDFINDYDRFVVIDMETTGKKPFNKDYVSKQPKGWKAPGIVIEIGCQELLRENDGFVFGETYRTLVNPDSAMSLGSMGVHSIKPNDLKSAPKFKDVVSAFKEFVRGDLIVAHSYKNERDFINYEFARAGEVAWGEDVYTDENYICTQEIFSDLYPDSRKSLDVMCDRLWIDRSDRFVGHGALLDAILTAEAFIKLVDQNK